MTTATTNHVSELRARRDWRFPKGRLSPSQVKSFMACPSCYEMKYVNGVWPPTKPELLVGRAVHSGLEAARKTILDGRVKDFDSAIEVAWEGWGSPGQDDIEMGAKRDLFYQGAKESINVDELLPDVERYVKFFAPKVLERDMEAGLLAVEARALGLGHPLDDAEANDGYDPVFPFQFEAYIDVMYQNGTTQDVKTAGRAAAPSFETLLQQMLYGLPWHRNGQDLMLGITQLVKHKKLDDESYRVFWCKPTAEEYDRLETKVLLVAEQIDHSMGTGLFEPRPNRLCDFAHGFPSYWMANEGGVHETA